MVEWMHVEVEGLYWDVAVQTAVVDGRTRLIGLQLAPLGDEPALISSDQLRTLPLRQIIQAAADAASQGRSIDDLLEVRRFDDDGTLSSEFLKTVASAYTMAIEDGLSPNHFVRTTWDVSRAQANQWIGRARELGFIADEA